MSTNLIRNFSFENGLENWNQSGGAGTGQIQAAYQGQIIADLSNLSFPPEVVISQLVRVPAEATHFHVVYSVLPVSASHGPLAVQVEFRGSANLDPPLPLLRTDVIDLILQDALVTEAWQTRFAVTGEIPPGTAWARLRFVHPLVFSADRLFLDAVYMTTD